MVRECSILLVDDVEPVYNGIEERITNKYNNLKNCIIYYKPVFNDGKEKIINDLKRIIDENQIEFILSDRGFSTIYNCKITDDIKRDPESIKIDDIIIEVISSLSLARISSIKSFIIYTYDPFSPFIRKELRELRGKIFNSVLEKLPFDNVSLLHKVVRTIETSSIYRRPGRTGIYPNGVDDITSIGTLDACKRYGYFLGDVLNDVIEDVKRPDFDNRLDPYSYSKFGNYEALKYIRSLEDRSKNNGIKLGTLSCWGEMYGSERYLVDVPFKTYYKHINDFIIVNNLNEIFYQDRDKKKFEKCQWVCFKYCVDKDDRTYLKSVQMSLKNEQSELVQKWLPLLHTSIFFCDDNAWKIPVINISSDDTINYTSHITLFFAINEIRETDFNGTFNFTLFSESCNSDNLPYEDLKNIAFEQFAPVLEPKLVEQILPEKNIEILRQATRAAISQVMARNMSHNIGSHVLSRIKNENYSLTKANSKVLFEFMQKRMEFIANGMFASFQSNFDLFNEVLKFYTDSVEKDRHSLLFDNISGNEKILSKNILITKNSGTGSNVLVGIPNGSLGFQAVHIFIENIIRNSVKHNTQYPSNEGDINLIYEISVEDNNRYPNYFKVKITDNFEKFNESIDPDTINRIISKPILDNGMLRPGGWGLLEMKICAAYLAGVPIQYIDQSHNENIIDINGIEEKIPPVLFIDKDSYGNLIYTIYLQKPIIAILTDKGLCSNLQGIERINNIYSIERTGTKHRFAVFTDAEQAKKHQAFTNQPSLFFTPDVDDMDIKSEAVLWEKYKKINKWDENIVILSKPNKDAELINGKEYIILDDHGKWRTESKNNEILNKNLSQVIYYEYLSSTAPYYEKINGISDTLVNAEIYEMAVTNIVILDERVQKTLEPEIQNLKMGNIFIPPITEDTTLTNTSSNKIKVWFNCAISASKCLTIDYLLIHRSLLGNNKLDVEEIKKFINPKFVIYVSGGGIPPNLINGDFYLPFDVLSSCLLGKAGKLSLVHILKSLRPIYKNEI